MTSFKEEANQIFLSYSNGEYGFAGALFQMTQAIEAHAPWAEQEQAPEQAEAIVDALTALYRRALDYGDMPTASEANWDVKEKAKAFVRDERLAHRLTDKFCHARGLEEPVEEWHVEQEEIYHPPPRPIPEGWNPAWGDPP